MQYLSNYLRTQFNLSFQGSHLIFIRGDQYSFVQQGVPSVWIGNGFDRVDVVKKWLATKYHTPLDNISQPLDYESGARAAGMNFLIGYEVSQQDQPPTWNEGDFFGSKFGKRLPVYMKK